jgi:hypothetical protein
VVVLIMTVPSFAVAGKGVGEAQESEEGDGRKHGWVVSVYRLKNDGNAAERNNGWQRAV